MRCWGWNYHGQVMLVAAFCLRGVEFVGGSFFLADAMCV